MTEVRKTDLSLTEIMTNMRDGWVQEKRRQKCGGTWTGQYTIKFSVLALCRSNLNPYCLGRKAAFFSVGI
jgi:hypothetical protein